MRRVCLWLYLRYRSNLLCCVELHGFLLLLLLTKINIISDHPGWTPGSAVNEWDKEKPGRGGLLANLVTFSGLPFWLVLESVGLTERWNGLLSKPHNIPNLNNYSISFHLFERRLTYGREINNKTAPREAAVWYRTRCWNEVTKQCDFEILM